MTRFRGGVRPSGRADALQRRSKIDAVRNARLRAEAPMETAKIKLVTVIASSEVQDRLIDDLRRLGATGYTTSAANGGGLHGPRRKGMWELGNVRIETLVPREVADAILECVVRSYESLSIIAFMHDVEAVPPDHFVKPAQA
jgi:hypothetical protein